MTRNDRDVVLIWNYQSPTRFYYAHLSQDNTIYPHNGIFVVDDADRRRIDDQWNGTGRRDARDRPTPTGTTYAWTTARATGAIAVYVDGAARAVDDRHRHHLRGGRAAFGSFDNYGRVRDVCVAGTPVRR